MTFPDYVIDNFISATIEAVERLREQNPELFKKYADSQSSDPVPPS